jgi:hypothetical protein
VLRAAVLAVYTAVTWRMCTESRPICYFEVALANAVPVPLDVVENAQNHRRVCVFAEALIRGFPVPVAHITALAQVALRMRSAGPCGPVVKH